jgi:hypothetical protein
LKINTLEEFQDRAPPELLLPADDHQLMLNRLKFEEDERKR